jgi:hypothetical protein
MDGAIIVAGAVIVGSSSNILKQAASVWRLSQAALAARHAKAAEVRTILRSRAWLATGTHGLARGSGALPVCRRQRPRCKYALTSSDNADQAALLSLRCIGG